MRTALLASITACWLAACSGSEPSMSMEAELDDDFKGCPEDIPPFLPGLKAEGEQLAVSLVSADPSEPERYSNDWTVELSAPDAEIVRGQTFMPIHGHDGRVVPELKPLSNPGEFEVDHLNFTMRGPWEVRLWLRSDAVEEDYVVFHVCVAK